jgi:hypothetical protein
MQREREGPRYWPHPQDLVPEKSWLLGAEPSYEVEEPLCHPQPAVQQLSMHFCFAILIKFE